MDDALKEFKEYYSLSSKLIKEVSKEDLGEVSRIMALQLADYQQRFGKIPDCDLLGLLGIVEISEEHAKLLRDGMQILIRHLGAIKDEPDEEDGTLH
jgi:hypothetical protein